MSLTGVVLTFNNISTIRKTLASLKEITDEIVIVDSGSTDGTFEVVKRVADVVKTRDFKGYSVQKEFAFGLASSDWIISLDADEFLSKPLISEIKKIKKTIEADKPEVYSGYSIPVLSFFLGKPLKYGGMYPDFHIRMFKKNCGQVQNLKVHEGIILDGKNKKLKSPICHFPYKNISHLVTKFNNYATLAAEQLFRDNKKQRTTLLNILLRPVYSFFIKYFFRFGFLDGIRGLIYHICHSFYVFLKYARLKELYEYQPDE